MLHNYIEIVFIPIVDLKRVFKHLEKQSIISIFTCDKKKKVNVIQFLDPSLILCRLLHYIYLVLGLRVILSDQYSQGWKVGGKGKHLLP